jgi:hypothetical protein
MKMNYDNLNKNIYNTSKSFLKKVNIGDKVKIHLYNSNGVNLYDPFSNILNTTVVSIEHVKSISGLCWASYRIGVTKNYAFDKLNEEMSSIDKILLSNIRKYKIIKKGQK